MKCTICRSALGEGEGARAVGNMGGLVVVADVCFTCVPRGGRTVLHISAVDVTDRLVAGVTFTDLRFTLKAER